MDIVLAGIVLALVLVVLGSGFAFALLPCILLLVVLASSRVCSVASVAARALMILVASGFNCLKAISRALVALSNAVLVVFTVCKAVCAAVLSVLSAASLMFALLGL